MKIESMFFDMDGTLVDYPNEPFHSSWDALADALPKEIRKEWFKVRDFYYPKKELYAEWYKKQVAFLKGIRISVFNQYLFPVPYSSGVKEFFSNKNGYVTGIVSAGVGLVAERVAEEFEFDFVISNLIEVFNGVLTGEGKHSMNLWRKDSNILRIAKEKNLDLQRTIYVGDNDNDIPAFNVVGIPVAFNPKTESTRSSAKYVINDFRELNKILETEK